MTRVAFIGVGAMGSRMARRLMDAGHDLIVWNRTAEKTQGLIDLGATAAESPAGATRRCEVVLTMLSDPPALQAVTEGPNGIAAGADDSITVIEMSTVGPAAIHRLREALPDETSLLDAPVLGSLSEAESASLKIFVGGSESVAERWTPLLSVLGTPLYLGPLGSGAGAKLVANSTLLGVLGVLGEALALADGLGLAREKAFEVLAATPVAAQAERRRPPIEKSEFPFHFALALAHKDADLVAEAAAEANVDLRLAEAARSWFADAEASDLGKEDYSAVLAYILGMPRT
jgi:3-hydroxyisobutyrate dehydrogenase-like beta-hydroxyacid dehydrogenase